MVRHQTKRTRAGVGVTEKGQKLSVRQLGGMCDSICVIGNDTKVATGVPLGLGCRTLNRGTLVQLAVGASV